MLLHATSRRHPANPGQTRRRPTALAQAAALVLLLVSAGAGQAQGQAASAPANPLGSIFQAIGQGLGGAVVPGAAGAMGNNAAAAAAAAAAANAAGNKGNAAALQALAGQKAGPGGPISPQHLALFNKGTVTGADLYDTLRGMRQDLLAQRSVKAYAELGLSLQAMGADALSGGASGMDMGALAKQVAVPAFMNLIKSYAASTAMQALDDHLQYLLGDRRAALAEESITLTLPPGADGPTAKRVITMASMIVAARVTNKMLDKADADFKSLQTDYADLLKQRQAAAEVLVAVVDERRLALRNNDAAARAKSDAELLKSLSPKDLEFIDTKLNTLDLKDFVKDMSAQNLAINFMKSKDPEKFKDYRAKADKAVALTNGYVRTMSGIVAFGSMTLNFAQSVAAIGAQKRLDNLITAMPLIGEFITAAAPLGKKSIEMAFTGITLPLTADGGGGGLFGGLFGGGSKAFLVTKGGKTEAVSKVSDVVAQMQGTPAAELFPNALFYGDSNGWLRRVYSCDKAESGRMVDAAVPKDVRTKFAAEYLGYDEDKAGEFAFVNVLSLPAKTRNERELPNSLLGTDQRKRASSQSLADVQNAVAANYKDWSVDQFLRLIFQNREGTAAYAQLELGDVTIKPVPSPAAVFAYESQFEACRRSADRDIDGGASHAAPAAAPAAAAAAAATGSDSQTPAAGKKPAGKAPAKKK